MKTKKSNPKVAGGPSCSGRVLLLAMLLSGGNVLAGTAGFVYSTPGEFIGAGDFNGDGVLDVVVLDRASGNARVGYQTNGVLTWSAPIVSGVPGVEAMAVGRFRDTNADAIAVTSMRQNRVHLARLDGTGGTNALMRLRGIGPNLLAGLAAPYGTNGIYDSVAIGSAANNRSPGATLLENWAFVGDALSAYQDSIAQESYLDSGNALTLAGAETFLVAMQRDTNDTLVGYSVSNHFSVVLSRSGLPRGSQYAFGRFNNEALPRFFFYVPGQSNLVMHTISQTSSNYLFDAMVALALSEPVQGVFYVERGTDGVALVQFGDGVQGLTLPGGVATLSSVYRTGAGAAGNTYTGIIPLANGNFALLDAAPGALSSAHSQVVQFNGTSFFQLSTGNMSRVSSRSTRPNVWLFQTEPFVTENALYISSTNVPDWSSAAVISSGVLSVNTETDAGTASGLGNSVSNNLGPLPAGVAFAVPDQYLDSVSLFAYAPPRPPEPINIAISPPPGLYGSPVQASLTIVSGTPKVFYRVGPSDSYHIYGGAFLLTNDVTVQYYGTNSTGRSQLYAASYQFGRSGHSGTQPALDLAPGTTNPAPVIQTNLVTISPNGTVFYSRRPAVPTTPGFYGPSPYLGFYQSPFAQSNAFSYFYLENFESGTANLPGTGISGGWTIGAPGATTDSVDADDGLVDGSGTGGHSLYSAGQTTFTIVFYAPALGGHLPTHVGVVWTDVGNTTSGVYGYGNVLVSANDSNGVPLGLRIGSNLGDGTPWGGTAEDRFFGVVNRGGISSFSITMTNSTDWEIDHIQYGYLPPSGFDGTVWAINLDGSSETYVTTGSRPRVSRDGRWLAMLRGGDPFSNQGNLWVHDLLTGYENVLVNNTGSIIGFDWDLTNTNLIFDFNNTFWRVGLTTPAVQLPIPAVLGQGALAVSPVDGRLAYHVTYPGPIGLYEAAPDGSSHSNLNVGAISPMWPAWAPDGQQIVFSDNQNVSPSVDDGQNLWMVKPDGSALTLMTAFNDPLNGFPHGAIFSPDGSALVGAATIYYTNGLWVIPLTPDRSDCDGPPLRLPTAPGDPIDFAGSIIAAQAPLTSVAPRLFILLGAEATVYWSAAYDGFSLEYSLSIGPDANWVSIPGPYAFDGYYFQYSEALANLSQQKFFRLHKVLAQ